MNFMETLSHKPPNPKILHDQTFILLYHLFLASLRQLLINITYKYLYCKESLHPSDLIIWLDQSSLLLHHIFLSH